MDEPYLRPSDELQPDRQAVDVFSHENPAYVNTYIRMRVRLPTGTGESTAAADRARQAITRHGFPPLVIEQGKVVLSGFVIEPQHDEHVKVRWIGQPDVNSAPYRRTFLSVYAVLLLEAGLTVQYVGDESELHLVCYLN